MLAARGKPAFSRMSDACAVRPPEVLHVADEIVLAAHSPEARIERFLLGNAGRGATTIIVSRIHDALSGKREEALVDRAIERARVAALEVGAARGADHQRVA